MAVKNEYSLQMTSNSMITVSNGANIFNENFITIEFWIKTSLNSNRVVIDTNLQNSGIHSQTNSDGRIFIGYTTSDRVGSIKSITDGIAHHIVGLINRTTREMSLYVDGILQERKTGSATIPSSHTHLYIGNRSGSTSLGIVGEIDEFRIYKRIKSDSEIQSLPKIENESNVFVLSLNEGSGLIVKDRDGVYTCNITGSTTWVDGLVDLSVVKFLISSEGETSSIVAGKKNNDTSIPTMTSDTAPSGRAFAGSVYNASYASWKAFNGIDDVEGYASLNGSGGVGYLGYEFNDSISLYKYAVRSNGSGYLNRMPKDWTFEGSNDGTNWTVLDTQSNQIWATQYTDKTYLLDEHIHYTKFKMYRLNWTANNGFASYTDVNELKMFEVVVPKLIKVPSLSESDFNKYGMGKDVEINLYDYVISTSDINNSSKLLGSGKVFKQKIDRSKHKAHKIILG